MNCAVYYYGFKAPDKNHVEVGQSHCGVLRTLREHAKLLGKSSERLEQLTDLLSTYPQGDISIANYETCLVITGPDSLIKKLINSGDVFPLPLSDEDDGLE